MWLSGPPSASVCRSGTAGRTPPSWRSRPGWSAICPGRLVGLSIDAEEPSRLPARPADARAAHPPGEGDVQHLHRPGAVGRGGLHVRRVPRRRRDCADRPPHPPPHHRPGGGAAAVRLQPGPPGFFDTVVVEAHGRAAAIVDAARGRGVLLASSMRITSGSRAARRPRRPIAAVLEAFGAVDGGASSGDGPPCPRRSCAGARF
jgi:hypothetical protein